MRKIALSLVFLVCLPAASFAQCKEGALGTVRTITLNDDAGFMIGAKHEGSIDLKQKEIILTFDDGPVPGSTEKILDILKENCIKANFFLMGQNAQAHPDLVRRIAAEGHAIGYHSWSHPRLHLLDYSGVEMEVGKGIGAVEAALQETGYHPTNFFRYPHLNRSEETDYIVRSHGLVAFDGDFMAPDWEERDPAILRDIMMMQIRTGGTKGIAILHDVQDRTVAYLPLLLQSLEDEGYRIVHIVPGP